MKAKPTWITDRVPTHDDDVSLMLRYSSVVGCYDLEDREWCSEGDVLDADEVFGWCELPDYPDLETATAPSWSKMVPK